MQIYTAQQMNPENEKEQIPFNKYVRGRGKERGYGHSFALKVELDNIATENISFGSQNSSKTLLMYI